jgi:nucleotide-binding universal stress UspA family protein
MKVSRILVPVDYSDQARRALEYAASLAESFGASLDVIHCWDRPSYVPDDVFIKRGGARRSLAEVLREDAEREMAEFLAQSSLPSGVAIERHLVGGEPVAAVLAKLKADSYDVVVIGTHGRSGVRQLLLGSVAGRLVRLSPVPVITIPPPREASAA